MKRIVPLLVGLCLLVGLAAPALAQVPPLPHAFYGDLTINDSSAPIGATVEARGEGVTTGIEGNPITVTEDGKYGGPGGLDPKLVVQGDIEDGTIITFYVNDVSTEQTAEWHSGEVTELDLSVTIVVPPARPRPSPSAPVIETSLFGVEADFPISEDGEILETITATSEDGMLTITLPEGTIALDEDGNPLGSLDISVDADPPDPPEDAHIIGLAYDFGPDGATFDPWIMLEWSYDPEALPEDVAEEDLVIAYYDEEAGEWVELDCVVDTENNTITASVEHFTTFAIIAPAPEEEEVIVIAPPEEEEEVVPPEEEEVVPPEEEEVVPPEEEVAPPEEEVVTPEEVMPPAKPAINYWPLIGGIIGGVIVVALLIFFLVIRRRRAD